MKTIISYDKDDKKLNGYYVKDIDDVFNYMSVNEYKKVSYLKELRWKDKNDITKGYANTKKIYIEK